MVARPFEEYRNTFKHAYLERQDGILEIRLHTNGGELTVGHSEHTDYLNLLEEIGRDQENRVIILTGTGENFAHIKGFGPLKEPPVYWARAHANTRRLMMNLLELEAPMIACINGPATVHAEWALLADIVLTADHAYFQDYTHLETDQNYLTPGDGVHVFWPHILGLTRGRYFLLTGQKLSAQEALTLGVVNEVMPKDKLMPRAREIARKLIKSNPLSLRFARPLMLQDIRRRMLDDLGYGMALEGMDVAQQYIDKHDIGKK